jgi:hypothetical protein
MSHIYLQLSAYNSLFSSLDCNKRTRNCSTPPSLQQHAHPSHRYCKLERGFCSSKCPSLAFVADCSSGLNHSSWRFNLNELPLNR